VLVTDGGTGQGRSALAATRALHDAGYRVAVGVSADFNLAASSRSCQHIVHLPSATEPGYADAVRAELRRLSASSPLAAEAALVVASDAAMVALELPEAELVDKGALEARCAAVPGLDVPPSAVCATTSEMRLAAERFGFPVVIKPVVSTWPARTIGDVSELPSDLDGSVVVQPFLEGQLEAISGVMHNGSLLAAVHQRALRTWPVSCGPSCAAVTVERDREREKQIAALLVDHRGLFQAQFLGGYLIDLNPRVYGSLPLALTAGVNLVAVSVDADLASGPNGARPLAAEVGVMYRWIEGDVRNVMAQVRSGDVGLLAGLRWLRPRRGTAHSVFSRRDLGPVLARVRFAGASR